MTSASRILAAAAFSLLAVAGAQAETYEGVHSAVSANSRSDINAQAVVAAHSADPYTDVAGQGVLSVAATNDRAAVRAQAYAAAHSADPYAEGYGQGVASIGRSSVDRAVVRAEARAASRGSDLAL